MPDRSAALRVLLLIHDLEVGGAQVALCGLAEGLRAGGIEPLVCGWRAGGPLAPRLERAGVEVLPPLVAAGGRGRLRAPLRLRRLLLRRRIDLLHAHLSDAAVFAWLAHRLCGVPYLLTHHSRDLLDNWPRERALSRRLRWLLLRAAATDAALHVAVAKSVAEAVRTELRVPTERIAVVQNGVPIPEAASVTEARRGRDSRREKGAGPLLLFVGRLAPEKGPDLLLEAAPEILARRPGARFVLLGEGPLRPRLAARAAECGVADRVTLAGSVPDVTPWLDAADLLVATSREEGLSLSILEAMARGLPVVASDVPGNRELVGDDECGRLFLPGDPGAAALAVLAALGDAPESERRAERARSRVAVHQDAEGVSRRHREIYAGLAPARRPDPARTRTLGVDVDVVDRAEAVDRIVAWSRDGEQGLVVTPNLDHAARLRRDPDLRRVYEQARLVVADGMPLVWASRLGPHPLPERVAGSDLVLPLAAAAAREGLSVFLLGSTLPVLCRAASRLVAHAPGLAVAGVFAPPFGFDAESPENAGVAELIALARPDLLLVSLGAPKQELWAARWLPALPVRAVVCVGAALDFIAGSQVRAPELLRRIGLEWLYRLAREPRRLGPRYLADLAQLGPLLVEQLRQRRHERPR